MGPAWKIADSGRDPCPADDKILLVETLGMVYLPRLAIPAANEAPAETAQCRSGTLPSCSILRWEDT
jgi:hypothetical protein